VKRYRQIAGFILAGGVSSRMGHDKGLLDFGGVPLILRTARLIEPLVAEVTVVGSPRRYTKLGLHVIADNVQVQSRPGSSGYGPLAGIATSLGATRSPWNLILACDLPYLSAEWIDWLLSRALQSRGKAVVPRTERGLEPLAAVYRRECGAQIAAALARGVRKVSDVIEELGVDYVYPREWRRIDPHGLILKNMNAPGDYREARAWWTTERVNKSEHVIEPPQAPKQKRRSAPRLRK
jgi:molybdopterin-guanine dinucleotide biosynthesis protein A